MQKKKKSMLKFLSNLKHLIKKYIINCKVTLLFFREINVCYNLIYVKLICKFLNYFTIFNYVFEYIFFLLLGL